ncbi:hypothetical protein SD427_14985 [Chryseobacterium sp. JJR-5R]|uniref:hypothetical protein n=1 Tax=Chryseobacterium sp. JJR-5R TaxID=3093923 RepID=UPI002A75979C|nr:hypothetical protein [Chryseobacterium sp. JJR-5R]WPO82060.1 hypothetical protein SD427_14985 [Chryseobacterium sp. JJR-5R]
MENINNRGFHNTMAEKLYFIKINPVAAKINLYNRLCREEDHQVLDFLGEDKKTSLELIRKKVRENAEGLSGEELLGIVNWFSTQHASDPEEMKTQLFVHGIDLFYEITSSVHTEHFLQVLSDYEKNSQITISHFTDSENFNRFLVYGIFFTGLVNKEKTENDYLFETLKSEHAKIYSLAENEYHAKNPAQTVPEDLYDYFKNLFDSTRFYKGGVIKLHSDT